MKRLTGLTVTWQDATIDPAEYEVLMGDIVALEMMDPPVKADRPTAFFAGITRACVSRTGRPAALVAPAGAEDLATFANRIRHIGTNYYDTEAADPPDPT